ncbi:outer membrane biosynthesis protein TonB [Prosthecobacter fusiformis]|uniref:Outer membrane biosynthesis protein TonB n=1 Tax=Prosthecobacter fusiformis TaxID=48464 RepID=A0A4R7S5E5_9BACT|nr:energy transducer TonB [Prosthecobacter fusiformis]TDU72866.1 outer membrane biosynthesis protein TonB [Prosthecobacter fusiformis]
MSQLALLGSPALSLSKKAEAVATPKQATVWRFRCPDDSLCGVAWLTGIAGTFLLIGIVGMLRFQNFEPITFAGRAGLGAVDNDSTDVSMAELLAEVEESQENPTEEVVEETLEIPEPVEVQIETLELPEMMEPLVTEDLFTVPAAPKIETVQKPVDPAKPKPKTQPRPAVAKPASRPATSTMTTAGGTAGSGGGGGGTGRAGAGAGKGRLPTPPFPSGARSRGVTGTVTFSLRVSPAGKVEYAAVVSSNCSNGGFTASEQSQLSSYICRNWYLPGRMGNLRLPVRFQLR